MVKVVVHIMPREGMRDPQGATVADALGRLGFDGVRQVRIGRRIELTFADAAPEEAHKMAQAMCERLLANPTTETWTTEAWKVDTA